MEKIKMKRDNIQVALIIIGIIMLFIYVLLMGFGIKRTQEMKQELADLQNRDQTSQPMETPTSAPKAEYGFPEKSPEILPPGKWQVNSDKGMTIETDCGNSIQTTFLKVTDVRRAAGKTEVQILGEWLGNDDKIILSICGETQIIGRVYIIESSDSNPEKSFIQFYMYETFEKVGPSA